MNQALASSNYTDLLGDEPVGYADLLGVEGQPPKPIVRITPEVIEHICIKIAEGATLVKICEPDNMPSRYSIYSHFEAYPESRAKYERAIRLRTLNAIDGLASFGDADVRKYFDGEGNERVDAGSVSLKRLEHDNTKWLASKLIKETFGDKVINEHTGPNGTPLVSEANPIEVARRVAFILRQGLEASRQVETIQDGELVDG